MAKVYDVKGLWRLSNKFEHHAENLEIPEALSIIRIKYKNEIADSSKDDGRPNPTRPRDNHVIGPTSDLPTVDVANGKGIASKEQQKEHKRGSRHSLPSTVLWAHCYGKVLVFLCLY